MGSTTYQIDGTDILSKEMAELIFGKDVVEKKEPVKTIEDVRTTTRIRDLTQTTITLEHKHTTYYSNGETDSDINREIIRISRIESITMLKNTEAVLTINMMSERNHHIMCESKREADDAMTKLASYMQ